MMSDEALRERAGVMNRVLTAAKAADPRRAPVEAAQCVLWARLIPWRYTAEELMWAVEEHHRRSGDFLDTHHVVALVGDRRRDILARAGECPYPAELDGDQERERQFRGAWQDAAIRSALRGGRVDRQVAYRAACQITGVTGVLLDERQRVRRPRELTG